MAQTLFQSPPDCENVRIYGDGSPYLDPDFYRSSYAITDVITLVYTIEFSFPVALQTATDAHHCYANVGSIYALGSLASRLTPMVTQTLAPLAPGTPSSSAPAPPPPPPTQTPTNDRRSGTQREDDLVLLEQEIISSPWYASNALEPICGSPECAYLADHHGVRGMSCYTAFVIPNPDGTFGCWREECSAFTTRQIENAVKHQRTNHFNHKPFLCAPTSNTACAKRFSSLKDLQNHQRRCH